MEYKFSDFYDDYDEEEDYFEHEGKESFLFTLNFARGGKLDFIRALGDIYSHSGYGVKRDLGKAAFWYERGAITGDFYSQWNLGDLYSLHGDEIEEDFPRAFFWYEKAAAQGVAYAKKRMADLYYCGNGVEKNVQRAEELYRESAVEGNQEAANFLKEHFGYKD